MNKKEKDLYVIFFRQAGFECAKIGISKDPMARLDTLNRFSQKKKKNFGLYAIFDLNDDKICAEIEKVVYDKFPKAYGREYLDTHPERVFNLCKKEIKKRGVVLSFTKNEDWMNEDIGRRA